MHHLAPHVFWAAHELGLTPLQFLSCITLVVLPASWWVCRLKAST